MLQRVGVTAYGACGVWGLLCVGLAVYGVCDEWGYHVVVAVRYL